MEFSPLGDSALLIRLPDSTELDIVLKLFERLRAAGIPGVTDVAPAYTTIGVFFAPARLVDAGAQTDKIFKFLEDKIREALATQSTKVRTASTREIEIPVCYDSEFAFDLHEVAQRTRRSAQEIVDLHAAAKYRVNCVGFTPGFPFLSGLPKELATPRRETPRKEVPAGSVGIGGAQTGIYPLRSPGGWNILGRTPLRLFDPDKDPPALLRAGDRVRFRAINRVEFEKLLP